VATISSLDSLISLVTSAGYPNIKKISNNKIAVLTSENRVDVLKALAKAIKGSTYDKAPSSESSVGKVKLGTFSILAKPAGKQGSASAGVGNEQFLVDTVNKALKKLGSANILFKSSDKSFKITNCVKVESVGSDTTGRKKADVMFFTVGGKKIPISIKKDDAETWESADSYFSSQAKVIIDKAVKAKKTKLVKQGTYYTIEPNIAVTATRQEKMDVVFGSDLGSGGAVVTKTFSKDDFSINGESIKIEVSNIITDLSDVKGDKDVFFLIRNDKTRKSIPDYPGIRILASYKKRINKNVAIVER
jgi:hypothetical protein